MKNYTSNPEYEKIGYSGSNIKQGNLGSKISWNVCYAYCSYPEKVHLYIVSYRMVSGELFHVSFFDAKLFNGHPAYADLKNNLFDNAAAQKLLLEHVSLEELMNYSYDLGSKDGRNNMRGSIKSLLKEEY